MGFLKAVYSNDALLGRLFFSASLSMIPDYEKLQLWLKLYSFVSLDIIVAAGSDGGFALVRHLGGSRFR